MIMPPHSFVYRAKVGRIVDGDTLDMVIDQGLHCQRLERVRLLGVNCAEVRGQDSEKGKAATAWVSEWVTYSGWITKSEWPFIIQTEKSDAFGRYLANVWDAKTGECLNQALLNSGHAVPYKER